MNETRHIYDLCFDVARNVWTRQAPSGEYAEAVANIMFMTAAHESLQFRYRRQRGFGKTNQRGAFGLFQTEWAPALDSIGLLSDNPALMANVQNFLGPYSGRNLLRRLVDRHPFLLKAYKANPGNRNDDDADKQVFLGRLQRPDGDALAAVFCRLHYLRQPGAIPADPMEASRYAKKYYNTELGDATPERYYEAFLKALHEAKEP